MKKIIIINILLLSFLFAGAQQKLSLEECRKMASEQSEDIQIAQKTLQQAQLGKKAARAMYLPNVSASATAMYMFEDINEEIYMPTYVLNPATGELVPNVAMNPMTGEPIMGNDGNPVFNMYGYFPLDISLKGAYMAGINVEQPLFAGGKIINGNKMASLGVQMAADQIDLRRQESIQNVDQIYWLHVSVREKVKLAQQAVDMLKEILDYVNNNYETGMIHKNEVLKVEVQYNQARLDLQKAKSGLAMSRMALCQLTGLPFNTDLVLTDSIIDMSNNLSLVESNINTTNRPEYRLLEKAVQMQDKQVKLVMGDYLPTAGVRFGYSHTGGIELSGQDIDQGGSNIMASVNIPLFHWGEGYHKVKVAKLVKEQKELELQKNHELMQLEAEQCRLDLIDAQMRIQIAGNALSQADENIRLSKDNYEMGMVVLTDLLIAQTEWKKAWSELIEAKADYKFKQTKYLKATGNLLK